MVCSVSIRVSPGWLKVRDVHSSMGSVSRETISIAQAALPPVSGPFELLGLVVGLSSNIVVVGDGRFERLILPR